MLTNNVYVFCQVQTQCISLPDLVELCSEGVTFLLELGDSGHKLGTGVSLTGQLLPIELC